MKQSIAVKIGAIACAIALSAALAGCSSGASTAAADAQKANRAYMSQVNETMVELDEGLEAFVDAVSRGDVVNMRAQANNAYKSLDKLASIEAPEDLKSMRDDYVNGTTKLREALDAYIKLYTEMEADATLLIDSDEYNARIADIQALYDEGVALLEKADAAVAGTTETSSASAVGPAATGTTTNSSASSESAASGSASGESASSASGDNAGSAIGSALESLDKSEGSAETEGSDESASSDSASSTA